MQNFEEELKCLASAVAAVSAVFCQFDSLDVSSDADGKETLLCCCVSVLSL